MSTAINSTHQQDRAAQQKLVNARQHAGAQGQQQGAAFAKLFSLACDEDTDLDALQLDGKLFGLKAEGPAGDGDTPATARRKGGKAVAGSGGETAADGTPPEGLHPTAQANATLLALLAQAQSAQPNAVTVATAETAATSAVDSAAPGASASALSTGARAETDLAPAPAATPAELTTPEATGKSMPGKTVRELARQLGAAMNNASSAPDPVSLARDTGVAWGRQPAAEAGAGLAPLASGLEATGGQPTASAGHGAPTVAAHAATAEASSEPGAMGDGSEATGESAAAPVSVRSAGNDGQPPTGGMGGDALGGAEPSESGPAAETATTSADQWREQWGEAMDQMGQQVSYWASQGGVRQATLRVGNGWQQAMEVKLSMKGGQAHIEFQTDHEAARSAIAEGGAEVLREMLAQSGIDLGQVSVGAQTSGGSDGSPSPGQHGVPGQAVAHKSEAPAATVLQPRNAHSTGLDVYV